MTLDAIDQSRSARLNSRAELLRELRHKTVCLLRVDKEVDVRIICEGVGHHMWSSDCRPAFRGNHALRSSRLELRWSRHLPGGWPDGGPWSTGGKWTQQRAALAHTPIPDLICVRVSYVINK